MNCPRSLEAALKLTYPYSEKERWEWLPRYLDEKEPTLENFAKAVRASSSSAGRKRGRRFSPPFA